jgi:pilus assembly protein Flp/PilA
MWSRLRSATRRARDRGASAVEYGLLIGAIGAVVVGAVFGIGGMVKEAFQDTRTCLATQGTDPTACH